MSNKYVKYNTISIFTNRTKNCNNQIGISGRLERESRVAYDRAKGEGSGAERENSADAIRKTKEECGSCRADAVYPVS